MKKQRPHVIVVGAGVGGLASAARLAHQGYRVTVLEKGKEAGGRAGKLEVDGFTFDTGPTLLLMPEVLEETFTATGRKMADYLTLTRCDPNYRIHFPDGSDITLSTELVETQKELERLEPGSFKKYLEFLSVGKEQYDLSLSHFVGRNFDSAWEFFTPKNLGKALAIKAHRRMYPEVSRYFKDDRLRAALTFQTMYLGISPYDSPAVYGLLPYTELAMGIWFPKGGMHAIPLALEKVCREEGVQFHYRTTVARVIEEDGKAAAVELEDGRRMDAELVLLNADLPWAYENLLKGTRATLPGAEKLKYTSSAYMMYLGLKRKYDGLLHHNVVFGSDYKGSFDDIFKKFKVPDEPSFYLNAPAHTDPSLAPEGKDSLYVLVPVPHQHESIDWRVEGPRVRAKVMARMASLGYPDLENDIEVERTFTPDDYRVVLNLERGSAFGLSHNISQVGPFRPTNQDAHLRNVFFVGASTQPGTGLPMVMLSAKLVAERIETWAQGYVARDEVEAPAEAAA